MVILSSSGNDQKIRFEDDSITFPNSTIFSKLFEEVRSFDIAHPNKSFRFF